MTNIALNIVKIAIVISPLAGIVFAIGGFARLSLIGG